MDVGASRAGIDVLRRGGNAVDAVVATASALGVTIPFVAGPGGGGFMVIYNARTHTVSTIDGRETCLSACTTSLFIDPTTGQPMNYTAASDQPLSTGVPGNVATWATAVHNPALSRLLTPSGDPLPIGTWLRDPDLAHTYELIAHQGASAL
jgi:gamma-glutamyltranspeptidase / glutathione hydrolase